MLFPESNYKYNLAKLLKIFISLLLYQTYIKNAKDLY